MQTTNKVTALMTCVRYLSETARRFHHCSGRCGCPPWSPVCWGCGGVSWHPSQLLSSSSDSPRGQTVQQTPPLPCYTPRREPSVLSTAALLVSLVYCVALWKSVSHRERLSNSGMFSHTCFAFYGPSSFLQAVAEAAHVFYVTCCVTVLLLCVLGNNTEIIPYVLIRWCSLRWLLLHERSFAWHFLRLYEAWSKFRTGFQYFYTCIFFLLKSSTLYGKELKVDQTYTTDNQLNNTQIHYLLPSAKTCWQRRPRDETILLYSPLIKWLHQ